MNFFKSILSDEPDPPNRDPDSSSDSNRTPTNKTDDDDAGNSWTFGGLMKTLATQSESMLDTYRKDLSEFGSGLKKETEILTRAVKDLPVSLEAAQGAIDGVIKSTAEIISKEASIFISDDGESPDAAAEINRTVSSNSGRYSWYESQLSAIQSDASTFTVDPEDSEEYNKWKLGFQLGEEAYKAEIEVLISEDGALEGIYERIVPAEVYEETFWCRYFFRVDRLNQQERMREKLMKRVSVGDDDEELSWDVDDDDDDDKIEKKEKESGEKDMGEKKLDDSIVVEKQGDSIVEPRDSKNDEKEEANVVELSDCKVEEVAEAKSEELLKSNKGNAAEKNDAEKHENNEKRKIVVSHEDEDMGWDEIAEDVESGDEKKTSIAAEGGSSNREELRKRLSAADNDADDDDEDLNWDIEDDDDVDDVSAKA